MELYHYWLWIMPWMANIVKRNRFKVSQSKCNFAELKWHLRQTSQMLLPAPDACCRLEVMRFTTPCRMRCLCCIVVRSFEERMAFPARIMWIFKQLIDRGLLVKTSSLRFSKAIHGKAVRMQERNSFMRFLSGGDAIIYR